MRYALWRWIWSRSTANPINSTSNGRVRSRRGIESGKKRLRTDLLIALENVQPPPDDGLTGLGRLVVLEQGARPVRILDRVRRGGEQARRGKVGLRLVLGRHRRRGCRARPRAGVRTGAPRGRRAPWRKAPALVAAVTALALALVVSQTVTSIAVLHLPRRPRAWAVVVRARVVSARVSAAVPDLVLSSLSAIVAVTIVAISSPPPVVVAVVPPSSVIVVISSPRVPL
jgi:hypothetical protein